MELLDVSELVATQRQHLAGDMRELVTPVERVYVPEDEAIRTRIGIDA